MNPDETRGRRRLMGVAGSPRADFTNGTVDIVPVMLAASPFGLLVGTIGVQAGLSPLEVTLMSATVFAGASQVAAIDLMPEAPILLIAATTLLINIRFVLMGAALAPQLRGFPAAPLWGGLFFMADAVWALGLRRGQRSGLSPSYFLGLGVPLYLAWTAMTLVGALLGGVLTDPETYGVDFALTAMFLCIAMGFWQGRASVLPWAAAAVAAVLADRLLDGAWHIFAGAVAGMLVGALRPPTPAPRSEDATGDPPAA